jgi:hypothetical protein
MRSNSLREFDDNAHRRCDDNKINISKTLVEFNSIIIYQTELSCLLQSLRIPAQGRDALCKFFVADNLRQRPANEAQSDNSYVIKKHIAV